eukprot:CAMPEP_0196574234 /NCGR_PEP_ID=MMETSP1081-20130531/3996_1 /TAXON_ID=36882 /ORGANISM="Pyramimonas amylifera, Strain CCMP720" /LENGTH=192 /DNA_ID=CAMNT_0041892197 /DNA_START=317 /DNA_END=895 /DNA_ORIENTATION=+
MQDVFETLPQKQARDKVNVIKPIGPNNSVHRHLDFEKSSQNYLFDQEMSASDKALMSNYSKSTELHENPIVDTIIRNAIVGSKSENGDCCNITESEFLGDSQNSKRYGFALKGEFMYAHEYQQSKFPHLPEFMDEVGYNEEILPLVKKQAISEDVEANITPFKVKKRKADYDDLFDLAFISCSEYKKRINQT